MKALVTGAGGQLGRELQLTVPAGVELFACDRETLDVTDGSAIEITLDRERPDLLINAAAYTAVDRAESEAEEAQRLNGVAPGMLARAISARRLRMIHISTDFVFDGRAGRPYRPDDEPAPLSVYGRSKLDGERAAREEAGRRVLVLRTAWLYSGFGGNFVRTMLRLLEGGGEIPVVADQIGTPTWGRGLAEAVWRAAELPELDGIHHWTDAGVASWYDFAIAVQEEAIRLGCPFGDARIRPISWRNFPAAARRPDTAVLDKTETWTALGMEPRHWRSQLRAMLAHTIPAHIERAPERD